MTQTSHKATEVHHPRPMAHSTDPSRKRWFIVSVVATTCVAVFGWLYFFSGQIAELGKQIPGSLASDAIKNLTTQTKSFGETTASDFKTDLAPAATAAVADVQAKLKAQAELVEVVDQMTTQLAEEEPTDETATLLSESNQ